MDQPAYRLAVQVCNATADKLQRHVCQYFTDIIVTHARDEELEEIQTAHELIKRINRSSPALLHNVVPQLEEELRVQEVSIRVMATQTLGEMFADKSGADFAKKYPSTWATWLARKNDQTTSVRLAFVEGAKGVLMHMTLVEQREQIEGKLLCIHVSFMRCIDIRRRGFTGKTLGSGRESPCSRLSSVYTDRLRDGVASRF